MSSSEREQLKPCPFCGGAARCVKHSAGLPGTVGYDQWHGVSCTACNACVGASDRRFRIVAEAIAAWNRRAQASAEPAEMSPDFTDSARAALLWVLWHHQGGSSPVRQPIRFALGMGAHDRLNEHQIAQARVWQELHPVNPSVYPVGQVPEPIPEPVATVDADGFLVVLRGGYIPTNTRLYTGPERAPLTAEQVREIVKEAGFDRPKSLHAQRAAFISGLRHGEVAHSITAAKDLGALAREGER